MKEIADTGIIVALLTRNDLHHSWALAAFRAHAPLHTCEPFSRKPGASFRIPWRFSASFPGVISSSTRTSSFHMKCHVC